MGFVATAGAPELDDPGWIFVSYAHLQGSLQYVDSEKIEVLTMPGGGTLLRTFESAFETELRVHTVSRRQCGFKQHNPGASFIVMKPEWLGGFNARPFPLLTAPALEGTKLVLQTLAGLVTFELPYDAALTAHPREALLKAISGADLDLLELMESGFYHALIEGVHVYICGHLSTAALQSQLLGKAHEDSVVLPATRFIQAVEAGTNLAAPNSPVTIGARLGVTVKNAYGNTDRFSLGTTEPFPDFALSTKATKVIVDALKQTKDEEVHLRRLVGHPDVIRLTRGAVEVSQRILVVG